MSALTHSRRTAPRPQRPRPRHNPVRVHRWTTSENEPATFKLNSQLDALIRRLLPGQVDNHVRLRGLLIDFEDACRREGKRSTPPKFDRPVCKEEAVRKALVIQMDESRPHRPRKAADDIRALLIGYSVMYGKERTEPYTGAEEARAKAMNAALRDIDAASLLEDDEGIASSFERLMDAIENH